MREILFRGKATSEARDGEWVYGSLLAESPSTFPIIARDYDNDEDWISVIEWDTVDSKTIGQFTGITDKNGKKIFEGDIVHCWGGEYAFGFWEHKNTFAFTDISNYMQMGELGESEFVEVIGNIHDNPELLESEDTE